MAYDNDDVMAALGRAVMDMVAGQRKRGSDDSSIGLSLVHTVDQYLADDEDEPVDDEEALDHDHSMDG